MKLPRAQLDRALAMKLHEQGLWAIPCVRGQCGRGDAGHFMVQGGPEAFAAHYATVHPGEGVPEI